MVEIVNSILNLSFTQILQTFPKLPKAHSTLLTDTFISGLGHVTGRYCLVVITANQRMAIRFLYDTPLGKANSYAARPQCNTEECITEEEILNVAAVKIPQGQKNQCVFIPK